MSQTPGSPERLQPTLQSEIPQSPTGEQMGQTIDPVEEGRDFVRRKIDAKRQQRGNLDDVVKAELRGELTPEIKRKIRDKKTAAREVRNENEQRGQLSGDAINVGNVVARSLAEFAEAARQGIIAPPTHEPSKAVFDMLVQKLQSGISPRSASYIWPLVDGLLHENNYIQFSQPNEEPTQLEKDLEDMIAGRDDDPNEVFVHDVFTSAIQENKIPDMNPNFFREKIREIKEKKKNKILERGRSNKGPSIAEVEFERTFGDERDPEQREAMQLYEAIKSSSPEDFFKYYRSKIEDTIGAFAEKGITLTAEQAGKKVTEQIHKTLLYMVNTIYATTLAKAPKADFKTTANSLGVGFVNPNNVFNEAVSGKLSRLASNMKSYKGAIDLEFYTYERKSTEYFNEKTRRIESATIPTANLEAVNVQKFSESLREITEIELGALEYQYNFSLLIQHPPEDKGIFQTIAGYAKQNLKTETIDNLYILPYNEVIQAAVMSLEPMYERMFAKHDWKKSTALETELFEQLQPAEKKTLDQLQAYFKDRDVPSWAITRAFYHARLMSFGKEFKYQLLSSYADPLLKDSGKQTYLGEGSFARNSVYDVWESAKRWGKGTDPYILGLGTMPQNIMIDNKDFHPEELQKEGEKRWEDSFTNGKMSYFDHKYFRESNPIMSITNMTGMGGADGTGGWRVKYTYLHWLKDVVDIRTHDLDIKKDNTQLLVDGWKAVENIGVNVLKNYSENFVLTGDFDKDLVTYQDKYEHFFKFLYRRYFKEGIGNSLYEGTADENKYWSKLKSQLFAGKEVTPAMRKEILSQEIYNAMSVVLFERMPTEFVFMERRRSSQNGVTLQQELLEDFVGTESKKGKWQEDNETKDHVIKTKWETAFDDIIYVQQASRMDSIEKMKQMQQDAADPNTLGVLYGDLQNDRSEVNYAINEEVIDKKLRERYSKQLSPDADTTPERRREIENEIKRAKELYRGMFEKMKAKPKEGLLEEKWKQENISKYREARNWTKKRSEWFAETWKSGGFGMQFTADSAGQFMNRSATGEELISRTAEASMVISEATKNFVAGGAMLDGINAAVRTGREGWKEMYEGVKEVYSSAKMEDGDIAKSLVRQLTNWQILALRRDYDAMGPNEKLHFQMLNKNSSLAAQKVGEGVSYDWGPADIYDYVLLFAEKNIIPKYAKEENWQYKTLPPDWKNKMMAMLTGKEATGKRVRDYTNEVSAEAVRKLNKAGQVEVLSRNLPPIVGLVAFALIAAIVKKAFEEENE